VHTHILWFIFSSQSEFYTLSDTIMFIRKILFVHSWPHNTQTAHLQHKYVFTSWLNYEKKNLFKNKRDLFSPQNCIVFAPPVLEDVKSSLYSELPERPGRNQQHMKMKHAHSQPASHFSRRSPSFWALLSLSIKSSSKPAQQLQNGSKRVNLWHIALCNTFVCFRTRKQN
jgi:hypothetical protein